MRKRISVLAIGVITLLGCVSTPTQPAKFTATLDDQYKDGAVEVVGLGLQVERPGWNFGRPLFEGVSVGVKNLTQTPVTVEWAKSAINFSGTSHQVFLDGQKYIDAGRGAPDQVVAAGMNVSRAVFPAENVVYSGYDWVIRPIRETDVSVLLAVKVNGEDRFYTVTFKVEGLGE